MSVRLILLLVALLCGCDPGAKPFEQAQIHDQGHRYDQALSKYHEVMEYPDSEHHEAATGRAQELAANLAQVGPTFDEVEALVAKREFESARTKLQALESDLPGHPPIRSKLAWVKAESKKVPWVLDVRDTDDLGGEFVEVSNVDISTKMIAFTLTSTFTSSFLQQVCFEVSPRWSEKEGRGGKFWPKEFVVGNQSKTRVEFGFTPGNSLPDDVVEVKFLVRQFIRC